MTYPRSLSMRDGCLTVAMTDSNTKRVPTGITLSVNFCPPRDYIRVLRAHRYHLAPFGGWRHEYPVDESTTYGYPISWSPRTL